MGADEVAGRREPEEQKQNYKRSGGQRYGLSQGGWAGASSSCFGFRDDLAWVSPSGCWGRRGDDRCGCPVPVPLSTQDNWLQKGPGRVVSAGGDGSMTRVSWWARTSGLVYCLGREGWVRGEARLEASGPAAFSWCPLAPAAPRRSCAALVLSRLLVSGQLLPTFGLSVTEM